MTDILATLRHAEATAKANRMSRADKMRYLREHGWRLTSTSGKTQRWQAKDGTTGTLSGATAIQLMRELQP